jgi:hypothetical protein
MAESFKGVWPDGISTTLWNLDLLLPSAERPFPLPLMGVKLDWNFLSAYLFGIAVIFLFSWRRFSERSFDPVSDDYVVLRELAPTQLRGPGPTRQAYFYYAGVLVVGYTVLTFFASVVFRVLNAVPMAGLQVDIDEGALEGTSWPLTLALALAGFTSLFRPLELAERWLRQRAHLWVGIPVRIKERTRTLLLCLDKAIRSKEQAEVDRHIGLIPDWAKSRIQNGLGASRLAEKQVAVEKMVGAIADPSSWPDISVSEDMRLIAKRETQKAQAVLQRLEDIFKEDFNTSNAIQPAIAGDQKGAIEDAVPPSIEEDLARHHRQLRLMLDDAVEELSRSRRELGSILTVYAERSAQSKDIIDNTIRNAVEEAFQESDKLDTPFWLAVLLMPTFAIYSIAAALGLHGLLGTVKLSGVTVFATASLETLRIAMLYWLPLLVVFAWRQYLRDTGGWYSIGTRGLFRRGATRLIIVIMLSGIVAFAGSAVLAVAWIAISAENRVRFWTLLPNAIWYYTSASICSIAFVAITTWAAEILIVTRSRLWAFLLGLCCAIVVTSAVIGHVILWSLYDCKMLTCVVPKHTHPLLAIYEAYNASDFIVVFVLSFFAASFFVWPVGLKNSVSRHGMLEKTTISRVASVLVITIATGTIFVCGSVAHAYAEDRRQEAMIGDKQHKHPIVLGVRSDAEPFSYLAGTGSEKRYRGYMVDLCYSIFDGSAYSIELQEVTPLNRFEMLRMGR